jgi:hypothetical protein
LIDQPRLLFGCFGVIKGTNSLSNIPILKYFCRYMNVSGSRNSLLLIFLLAIFLSACKPDLDVPVPAAGEANFFKTIAIGDDFLSGYQDGALYKKGQLFSIPALLARQFNVAGGGGFFILPLMPDDYGLGLNPKPWEGTYLSKRVLGFRTNCEGETGLFPLSSNISPASADVYLLPVYGAMNNFSAPFLKIADMFNPQTGTPTGNIFYHRFASNPGVSTVLSDVNSANATFFTVWTGMEDIYDYARNGGYNKTILPPAQFEMYLDSLLRTLTSNGAKGIIADIPDASSFPFYTLVPYNGAELNANQADSLSQVWHVGGQYAHINFVEGDNAFVTEDSSAPGGYRQLVEGEMVTLSAPLDSMRCYYYGLLVQVIHDQYVLDSSEVNIISEHIQQYNTIIRQKAMQYNLAFADMNQFFKNVVSGIKWDGVDYDAEFISGGFFSLDAFHPNQKGYALISNEFIKAINATYHSTLPPVNCFECDGILFP